MEASLIVSPRLVYQLRVLTSVWYLDMDTYIDTELTVMNRNINVNKSTRDSGSIVGVQAHSYRHSPYQVTYFTPYRYH